MENENEGHSVPSRNEDPNLSAMKMFNQSGNPSNEKKSFHFR